MRARLRLIGTFDPRQFASLRDFQTVEGSGWRIEHLAAESSPACNHPLADVSFHNIDQHSSLAYEIQDIATLQYTNFPSIIGLEEPTLYLQKSLVYAFQLVANLQIGEAKDSTQWLQIENALRPLAQSLAPLGLRATLAIAVVLHGSEFLRSGSSAPRGILPTLLGENMDRLLAASKISPDCCLARLRSTDFDICIVLSSTRGTLTFNELTWYKQLIARAATAHVMQSLERCVAVFREMLRHANALDPLAAPGQTFLNTVNQLQKQVISARALAQDARSKLRLLQEFVEYAMPHLQPNLAEHPEELGLPMALAADSSEFQRYYDEPLNLLSDRASLLERDIQERIRMLSEIASLRYNLKIQVDLRWLQLIAVILTLVGLVFGALSFWGPSRPSDVQPQHESPAQQSDTRP